MKHLTKDDILKLLSREIIDEQSELYSAGIGDDDELRFDYNKEYSCAMGFYKARNILLNKLK